MATRKNRSNRARKTKKSSWAQEVRSVYFSMKKKNPQFTFSDAMKEASRRRK